MPRSIKEPASVTDGISNDLNLESNDSPTPEHFSDLDEAMNEAGLGENSPALVGEVKEVPLEPAEPALPDAPEPAEVTPSALPGAAEGADKAPVTEDDAEKRRQELESLDLDTVAPPPNVSPRNLVNFDKLREVAKHFKTEAAKATELSAKVQELESRTGLTPEVQKELDDHRRFRKIFDTENDPEFNKQFNEKLGTLDNDILDLLKRKGLSEETEKEIRALGLDKVSTKWWEESVFPNLSFVEREQIKKRLTERADTVDAKAKEVEKYSSQREGYLAEHNKELVTKFEAERTEISTHVNDLVKDIPWAQYAEIPANATAAEKKRLEAHNDNVRELDTNFQAALFPATPQARAEVAAAAVAAVQFSRDLTTAGAKLAEQAATIDKLQKEIAGIRSAGRLPVARPSSRGIPSSLADAGTLPDDDAIERGLSEAEA